MKTAHNFCVAVTYGKRLCVAAIATKHARCKRFLLEKKQKTAPRGVLSSNEILAVFFKKKFGVFWLVKFNLDTDEMLNGDIGSQLEGWQGGNRFSYGQKQLELSSTKPRAYVPTLGGG